VCSNPVGILLDTLRKHGATRSVMTACTIVHNIIAKDECGDVLLDQDYNFGEKVEPTLRGSII
jgi:hypothetical protein